MPTTVYAFSTKEWKLVATGPVNVIMSSKISPFAFAMMGSAVAPSNFIGHTVDAITIVTLDVKTGEFLYVLSDVNNDVLVS